MKVSPEHLRNKADYAEELGYRDHANLLRDAAETIEALQKQTPAPQTRAAGTAPPK